MRSHGYTEGAPFAEHVFVNCPFDDAYRPMFHALVFTLSAAGLVPRCALELGDSSQNRLDKIFRLVAECRYGVHDISRTECDPQLHLPRFNMPLELGVFLGCKHFGGSAHAAKACLIVDTEPFRYQRFLSDISGYDIHSHHGCPELLVRQVTEWLRVLLRGQELPGGARMWRRYVRFQADLPVLLQRAQVEAEELTFADYSLLCQRWLRSL